MQHCETGTPVNLTVTGTVSIASGTLLGFYVNNKTAGGTLVLRSGAAGAATGTAISGTITPLIGYHRFNAYCPSGCHATIAVQAMDITFFFAAG
jgi:hypothetical protein